jgi:arylsulfatase A-like enzyme
LGLADRHVATVLAAVRDAGIAETTTTFVVADHGFATATKMLRPNALFGAAGLLLATPAGVVQARAVAVPEGGTAMVYFTDPETAERDRAKVLKLLAEREGVAAVIEPKDYEKLGLPNPKDNPQSPDLVLAAKEGYAFDGSVVGEEWLVPAILGRSSVGNHGYLADEPKMNALFIAAGRGIKPCTRVKLVENVDIAPTAAHLLGFEMPNVEGKVMTEILK